MKKLLSCLIVFLLTLSLLPAASAADADAVPMRYTPVKPTPDGVINPEEWGEPDLVTEPGNPAKPAKLEYWFRWSNTAMHFAVRVYTENFKAGIHDTGATYVIPRIQLTADEGLTYLGVISVLENGEVYIPHLGKVPVGGCAYRETEEGAELEFSYPLTVSYTEDDTDYLVMRIDYHESKPNLTAQKVCLFYSDEPADLPIAETDPAETEPAETDPAVTDAAEMDPADTSDPAPADTNPPPAAPQEPPVLPIVLAVAAVAAIAVIAVVFLKKKKK